MNQGHPVQLYVSLRAIWDLLLPLFCGIRPPMKSCLGAFTAGCICHRRELLETEVCGSRPGGSKKKKKRWGKKMTWAMFTNTTVNSKLAGKSGGETFCMLEVDSKTSAWSEDFTRISLAPFCPRLLLSRMAVIFFSLATCGKCSSPLFKRKAPFSLHAVLKEDVKELFPLHFCNSIDVHPKKKTRESKPFSYISFVCESTLLTHMVSNSYSNPT